MTAKRGRPPKTKKVPVVNKPQVKETPSKEPVKKQVIEKIVKKTITSQDWFSALNESGFNPPDMGITEKGANWEIVVSDKIEFKFTSRAGISKLVVK